VSAHAAVLGLLQASPELVAAVDGRIYPDEMDDPPVYPSVTFQKIGGGRARSAVKSSSLARASIQVSTWAKSRDETVQIAGLIRRALDRKRQLTLSGVPVDDCFYVSDIDLKDPDSGICFNHMSFKIHYREP